MFVARALLELLQAAHKIQKHDADAAEAEKGEGQTRHIAETPGSDAFLSPHNAMTA
jgi:hypothetical protein